MSKPRKTAVGNKTMAPITKSTARMLYNELVKSPEDRIALEKELPALVAARDKAVRAAKREQLQKERAAQMPDHVVKIRR
jgi:hypothetical protein